MNVPPGYARGHDPRGFGQLNVLLGHAHGHGPQRFGHVNVSGSVGSVGPPTKFSQRYCRTLTSVISTVLRSGSGTRAPWSQSWRVGLSPGLGGPSVRLGPLRVGESMRERVLGLSAVWPLLARACSRTLGRVAVGVWPYVIWTLAAWRCLICAR